nr:Tn3 family transposase [Thiocystis violacea]
MIANAVIYYNTALLSRIYAQKQAAGDTAAIEILRRISPCRLAAAHQPVRKVRVHAARPGRRS